MVYVIVYHTQKGLTSGFPFPQFHSWIYLLWYVTGNTYYNKPFYEKLRKLKLACINKWNLRTAILSTHKLAEIVYDTKPLGRDIKVTAALPHASQSSQPLLFSLHLYPQRKTEPKINCQSQFAIRTLFRSINSHLYFFLMYSRYLIC